jgi:hypothetical protein
MARSDLCSLQDVKDWLTGPGGPMGHSQDALLARLITSMSGAIYMYLSRQLIIPQQVTERYDGTGKRRLYLHSYPVLSISQLVVNDIAIPAAAPPIAGGTWPGVGYLEEPWNGIPPGRIQSLDLYGDWLTNFGAPAFVRGRQNILITYTAGYAVTGEAATIPPSPTEYQVAAPFGPWASDRGVTYTNGTPLLAVTGVPSVGQYSVAGGLYQFSDADVSQSVLISYGFIPAVLNNACIEWVAERYRYMTRIGQRAQTVQSQQTASYDLSAVPAFIAASLNPYRMVVPI